ncbi:MAG TPA: 2-C-methyl-D-erythritol 4-phosphate cytidylyltransferase [Candidatus Binataceae bacterium]|nr:2-C-methyl-D-erythritol 4-phosphate cytidylyltransferase [Candidatus Binataceae bacterium]
MKASAIIVAAGSGRRLGCELPKAFVPVGGRPMLDYSLRALAAVEDISEAVIALPAQMLSEARAIVRSAGLEIPVKLTPGGSERQDSVRIALELVGVENGVVVIHDAARPFAPARFFRDSIRAADSAAGAIVAIPVSDTLKRVEGNAIVATASRLGLYCAQTPQAFRRDLLVRAHRQAVENGISATDDADLVERLGTMVAIVEGSSRNFKITTQDDLALAQAVIAAGLPD